jgi:hypothetical protein
LCATFKTLSEQIAFALRQQESGTAVEEIICKMGIPEPTFYRWKKKFAGLGVSPQPRRVVSDAYEPTTAAAALHTNQRKRPVDGTRLRLFKV